MTDPKGFMIYVPIYYFPIKSTIHVGKPCHIPIDPYHIPTPQLPTSTRPISSKTPAIQSMFVHHQLPWTDDQIAHDFTLLPRCPHYMTTICDVCKIQVSMRWRSMRCEQRSLTQRMGQGELSWSLPL